MNWIPVAIFSAFMLAGVGSCVGAWFAWQRGQKSLAWPAVQGTVTASEVTTTSSDSGTNYYPSVSYEYQAAGQAMSGSRIAVGWAVSMGQGRAAEVVRQYAVGSKVNVYYDPAKPGYAVLERGANTRLVYSLAGGGVAAFAMGAAAKIFTRF